MTAEKKPFCPTCMPLLPDSEKAALMLTLAKKVVTLKYVRSSVCWKAQQLFSELLWALVNKNFEINRVSERKKYNL